MSARAKRPAATVRAPSQLAPATAVDPALVEGFIRGEARDVPGRPETSSDARAKRTRDGSRAVVERQSGARRRRTTVYFNPLTAQRLADHCAAEGVELSAVVEKAVRAFFEKAPRR